MEKRSFVNFPELAQILADDDAQNDLCSTLAVDIKDHLKSLSDSFDGYFPNLSVDPWIQDPFTIPISPRKRSECHCLSSRPTSAKPGSPRWLS